MNQPFVPLRYRLGARLIVPIVTTLAGVLAFLFVLIYLHVRQSIIITARAQVGQLASSIARQDDYTRRWLERSVESLSRLAVTFPYMNEEERNNADKQLIGLLSNERGRQIVTVALLDGKGGVKLRTYSSQGLLAASSSTASEEWTAQRIEALHAPLWHVSQVEADRSLTLRYAVPLMEKDAEGKQRTLGAFDTELSLLWFSERVRSFSSFENSITFFLSPNGQWTLPPSSDEPLAAIKNRMLGSLSGENNVTLDGRSYLLVYMPFASSNTRVGVLIPREDLFSSLDRLARLCVVIGLAALVLATYSLRRMSRTLLEPIATLKELVGRLARGELEAASTTPVMEISSRFPDEAQRLQRSTESLRLALKQRVRELALIGQTRERLFGEMALAHALQEASRPQSLPPSDKVEVAAFAYTAENICGDMYDYFFQDAHRLCCVMGNVAERGVPAALLTGRIIPLLHELLLSGLSPGEALTSINKVICPSSPCEQSMVSVLAGVLNLDNGHFRWACAGQLPPFRALGAEVGQLEWTGNVPLGIRDDERYTELEIQLRPGETLLFAGRRLLSISDTNGCIYGDRELIQFLAGSKSSLEQLVQSLYKEIRTHAGGAPQEDLTFFAVRWCEAAVV